MIIVLMGYMGSGKSTIGKQLSSVLDYDFIDLDDYIIKKENRTIANIFSDKGEIYFRKIESQYLKEILSQENNVVLALGGGTPCYANNIELIENDENVISFYLKLSIPYLSKRLFSEKDNRPLVSHLENLEELQEFVGKHLFERVQYYSKANYTVEAEEKSVKDIIESILLALI
ncbi:shikimate kinase [Winogradskyella vincentii]|uniref:Shikimate kinase n=1 Tax=Winogradskyella vincentii TaxID=2877122 RepID=A0ABS7Y1R6_9FLAO|nr:shikimate kinase [Winogradskyella vincentii]MCA0153275.1 shikimate kinase [Winogradskyella vincentii]